jgi:hypothetical protein
MDDAVWDTGSELPRIWTELRYERPHPYYGLDKDSLDMAFLLVSTSGTWVPTCQPACITTCPAVDTTCPAVLTQCPATDTQCPSVLTQCPSADTRCPSVETQCPTSETKCPAVDTKCPVVRTQCPMCPNNVVSAYTLTIREAMIKTDPGQRRKTVRILEVCPVVEADCLSL